MAIEYFPLHDPALKALKNLCELIGCNQRAHKSRLCKEHYLEKYEPATKGLDYVYAVLAKEVNKVKIGITKSPEKRLGGLQTGSPIELTMLGYIVGNKQLEDAIHDHLSDHRSHGEWFHMEPQTDIIVSMIVDNQLDELRALVSPLVGLTLQQKIRQIDEERKLENLS